MPVSRIIINPWLDIKIIVYSIGKIRSLKFF